MPGRSRRRKFRMQGKTVAGVAAFWDGSGRDHKRATARSHGERGPCVCRGYRAEVAIVRLTGKCLTCGAPLVLWVGLAPVRQMKAAFACPHCGVDLRLDVALSGYEPRFASEDVEVCELTAGEAETARGTVIYTDLPVPLELIGDLGPTSPFLAMAGLWGDRAEEYTARSHELQRLRDDVFPLARRASSVYGRGDFQALADVLARIESLEQIPELAEMHPVYQLGRLVDMLHLPFVDLAQRTAAGNELLTLMVRANEAHHDEYRGLLAALGADRRFAEHRRKVVETAMNVLDDADALLPGLAWEHISAEPPPSASDFRIMRSDFNELRARYVEIFELASQTLGYVGVIANIAERGAANSWCDGSTAGLKAVLRRQAWQREFILAEFPLAREFYDAVHRHSRNAFGHYSIEYDLETGELVDRDGARTSFVLFMGDYLEAARMTAYLLTVAEKFTLAIDDPDALHVQLEAAADAFAAAVHEAGQRNEKESGVQASQ